MRINIGQTTTLLRTQAINNSLQRNRSPEEQQENNAMRSDQVFLSPQGKSSSLLSSLINQKELIQMNKESLIKQELGEEGTKTGNFSKQLEEYERQLEEIDGQIAREMAKQAKSEEGEGEKNEKIPPNGDSEKSSEEHMAEVSINSFSADMAEMKAEIQEKREQEKQIIKAEQDSSCGSPSAERRLNKIAETEQMSDQIAPILEKDGWELGEIIFH